jgi:ribosome maturation factor RimP
MAKRAGKRKQKSEVPASLRQPDQEVLKRQRAFVNSVTRLAEPLCIGEGMELVLVEYQREPGGLTLRLYLDKPGGVTLDDCVNISRQLEDILDVNMQDAPPYRMEVSSPGLDRPVGKLNDFIRFTGHRAKIRLTTALKGRRHFTGVLAGVINEMVQLQVDNEMVSFNFKDISRARLINYNGER